jgi:hypothetical protein
VLGSVILLEYFLFGSRYNQAMNDQALPLSFKEAIEMGKYDEAFLNQYSEWRGFDRQIKLQFITKALTNRRLQLRKQWASLANQLDFSAKPHLLEAQKRVEQALRELNQDEERILVEYAGS